MKKIILAALLAATGVAHATVIKFDDLTNFQSIANGYNGLSWSGFSIIDSTIYSARKSGYVNGVISGNNVAFANTSGSFSSTTAFDLNSLYLTSAWNTGETVDIFGKLNGVNVYKQTIVVNTDKPTLLTLDWAGVTSVSFAISGGVNAGLGGSGSYLALDNLTINDTPAKVPEPASLALIGAGLLGLGALRRKPAR